MLLIVPCGIEMDRIARVHFNAIKLLIVPCGIEIALSARPLRAAGLLIVPCGIEIADVPVFAQMDYPFNRTMWN